jgi:alpha,alpha-trehalase
VNAALRRATRSTLAALPRPALRVSLPVLRAVRHATVLAGGAVAIACGVGATIPVAERDDVTALAPYEPSRALGALYHDVEMAGIFPDSKTFADARPREAPPAILAAYRVERASTDFSLRDFVGRHFDLPRSATAGVVSEKALPMEAHLRALWPALTRSADSSDSRSTLLPLPNRYVVPGGRFREVYYWDSYFTMLGLVASGRTDLVRGMLDNFVDLIHRTGHIPNGNRSYYLGRSQPPFFATMVGLYAQATDTASALAYLPAMEAEHAFWMDGADRVRAGTASRRVVRLPNGDLLNRYWDDNAGPRPESYREDVSLAESLPAEARVSFYRNVRAAAESGWDFSSRWMRDPSDLRTLEVVELAPVDLNAILYDAERTIAALRRARGRTGDEGVARRFDAAAAARRSALLAAAWDPASGYFYDGRWRVGTPVTDRPSMAPAALLYFGLPAPAQGAAAAARMELDFLRAGGFVTTRVASGQQWDAPNGWPPLQWLAIEGVRRYGRGDLADLARARWLTVNRKVYRATGRMMEKYDVIDTARVAGGGEYPTQDGFGWTNGVALGLLAQRLR